MEIESTTESTDGATIENALPSSVETTEPTQTNEGTERPAGYAPVDPETASPQEVKDRLDYLYRQVKDGERTRKDTNRILAEQSRLIDELGSRTNQVVTHLTEQQFINNEVQLQEQLDAAWQKGDSKLWNELQGKMIDLQVQKRMPRQEQPQQQTQPQNQPYNNAADIARDGGLGERETRVTQAWQDETDDNGNLIRPWAFNRSTEPGKFNPEYEAALVEANAVFKNARFANLTYEQKLAEIDRRMGTVKTGGSQNVLRGNLTTPRKTGKITLSPQAERIALKTKFAGKGKTDAEHREAYIKQIEKYDASKRGVRK